jgi:acetyltransferase-like isoleucine patch superfamily enzyme
MNICPICKESRMVMAEDSDREDRMCMECGQHYGPGRYRQMSGSGTVNFIKRIIGWANRLRTYPMYYRFRKQNISVGKGVSLGKGFRFLWGNMIVGDNVALQNTFCDDSAVITIGSNTFFGHNVMLLTPYHEMECLDEKRRKVVRCKPIHIGRGVWIASGVVVLAGVKIGAGAVVGAGSVVTKDVPSYTFAGGNPARVIRKLGNQP